MRAFFLLSLVCIIISSVSGRYADTGGNPFADHAAKFLPISFFAIPLLCAGQLFFLYDTSISCELLDKLFLTSSDSTLTIPDLKDYIAVQSNIKSRVKLVFEHI